MSTVAQKELVSFLLPLNGELASTPFCLGQVLFTISKSERGATCPDPSIRQLTDGK